MPDVIKCAKCSKLLSIGRHLVGKKVRCPRCKEIFVLEEGHFAAMEGVQETAPAPRGPHRGERSARPKPPPLPQEGAEEVDLGPAPRSAPDEGDRSPRFQPFTFSVSVLKDSKGILRGKVEGKVGPRGLYLRAKEEEDDVEIPAGSEVKHTGGNRLEVALGRRKLTLAVVKPRWYLRLFAAELAEFLQGERRELREQDYLMNPMWLVLGCLPFMMSVAAIALHNAGKIPPVEGWQGMVWSGVWGGIGGGFAGATIVLTQQDRLSPWLRIAGGVLFTILSFGLFFLGLYLFPEGF